MTEALTVLAAEADVQRWWLDEPSLTLQGSTPGSGAGGPIDVPLPGATPLYANDFQRVTYWTTAPGFALDFVMSK